MILKIMNKLTTTNQHAKKEGLKVVRKAFLSSTLSKRIWFSSLSWIQGMTFYRSITFLLARHATTKKRPMSLCFPQIQTTIPSPSKLWQQVTPKKATSGDNSTVGLERWFRHLCTVSPTFIPQPNLEKINIAAPLKIAAKE